MFPGIHGIRTEAETQLLPFEITAQPIFVHTGSAKGENYKEIFTLRVFPHSLTVLAIYSFFYAQERLNCHSKCHVL